MQFVCSECDTVMTLASSSSPEPGSMRVEFRCPDCERGVAMVTNEEETNIVIALDLPTGDEGTTDLSAATAGGGPRWSAEAMQRLERVPAFAREMARSHYEQFATSEGASEITPAVMDEATPHGLGPPRGGGS